MSEKTISKLSVASIILSASSIVLWLSWVPGVICGHIAISKIKADPHLKGKHLALVGLVVGYFFPAVFIGILLYLGGYLERQVNVTDHGQTVWTGSFPHDANEKNPLNRADTVLTPISVDGHTVGAIESRDKNLRLVFRPNTDIKEITVWKYQDYGAVTRITVDESSRSLILYYDHTLIRSKNYKAVVSLTNYKVDKYLVDRGQWCF